MIRRILLWILAMIVFKIILYINVFLLTSFLSPNYFSFNMIKLAPVVKNVLFSKILLNTFFILDCLIFLLFLTLQILWVFGVPSFLSGMMVGMILRKDIAKLTGIVMVFITLLIIGIVIVILISGVFYTALSAFSAKNYFDNLSKIVLYVVLGLILIFMSCCSSYFSGKAGNLIGLKLSIRGKRKESQVDI